MRNFSLVHSDYGGGIAQLLEYYKASVSVCVGVGECVCGVCVCVCGWVCVVCV